MTSTKKYRALPFFLWMLFPFAAFAETSVKSIFEELTYYVAHTIPILMTLVVAVFLWGIARFVSAAGDVEKRKSAKNLIIWGLVGIFVLVCFWGLIQILILSFFGTSTTPPKPSNWPPTVY